MELVLTHLFISLPLGLVREGGWGRAWERRMSGVGLVIHFSRSMCLHDFYNVGLCSLHSKCRFCVVCCGTSTLKTCTKLRPEDPSQDECETDKLLSLKFAQEFIWQQIKILLHNSDTTFKLISNKNGTFLTFSDKISGKI